MRYSWGIFGCNTVEKHAFFYLGAIWTLMCKVSSLLLVWFLAFGTVALLLPQDSYAQQDPIWTMHMFNRSLYNPAFVGSYSGARVAFAGRTQWVGIDGAPQTFALTADIPSRFLHGGVGLYILGDQVGPFSTTEVKGLYAYHAKVGGGRQPAEVHIGLNLGLISKTLDGTNWRPPDSKSDPVLFNEVVNQSSFDLGTGVALLGPGKRYYIGVGVNHVLEPTLRSFTRDTGEESSRLQRAIVASAGYRFFPTRDIVFEPSVLYRRTGSNGQFELNANLEINPVVFGFSFRQSDAFAAILGFWATERLFAAYSYDYTLSKLSAKASGSHEVYIGYTLPPKLKLFPPDLNVREKRKPLRGGFN